jgi:hypothetical protein
VGAPRPCLVDRSRGEPRAAQGGWTRRPRLVRGSASARRRGRNSLADS